MAICTRHGQAPQLRRRSDAIPNSHTTASDGTQTQLEAQRLERWRRDEDSSAGALC